MKKKKKKMPKKSLESCDPFFQFTTINFNKDYFPGLHTDNGNKDLWICMARPNGCQKPDVAATLCQKPDYKRWRQNDAL